MESESSSWEPSQGGFVIEAEKMRGIPSPMRPGT